MAVGNPDIRLLYRDDIISTIVDLLFLFAPHCPLYRDDIISTIVDKDTKVVFGPSIEMI